MAGSLDDELKRASEEVEAVAGRVHRVPDLDAAARAFSGLIDAGRIDRLAVSRDPMARAVSARVVGRHEVIDPEGQRDRIAEADMGLTGARLGIAEHGTLMLLPEEDHGRLAALLPPHHVAILGVSDLVGTLAEALETLEIEAQPATVTFVSGPSRTADIEQTLVSGIHGPAHLDILLVEESDAP